MPESFTAAQITDLLTELGADLNSRGIRAELFIVGGAAMALAYNTRRATRDIDAVFEPKTEIYEAAARLAARHDLPEGWLNDAMKGFLPGEDPDRRFVFSAAGINVSVPSPEYLLALKVHAARVDRDADDILELARICEVTTAEEVLTIVERIMGGRGQLLPKAQFLVEELFPADQPRATVRATIDGLTANVASATKSWLTKRREDREGRPPTPVKAPKPPRAGRCGAPTARGGSCRNRRGSCPNH